MLPCLCSFCIATDSKILATANSHLSPFFRANGACRHVAAALFDLEATIRRNELDTCTSVPCMWIKRKRLEENAVPMERLKIQKSEYGKEHKDYMKPCDFNPCSGSPTQSLTNKFYDALQETAPSCHWTKKRIYSCLRVEQMCGKFGAVNLHFICTGW